MNRWGNLEARSTKNDKILAPPPNQPSASWLGVGGQARGSGFKCFKCGEHGHRLAKCRKSMGICIEKAFSMEEAKFFYQKEKASIYDQPMLEEIGGDFT